MNAHAAPACVAAEARDYHVGLGIKASTQYPIVVPGIVRPRPNGIAAWSVFGQQAAMKQRPGIARAASNDDVVGLVDGDPARTIIRTEVKLAGLD